MIRHFALTLAGFAFLAVPAFAQDCSKCEESCDKAAKTAAKADLKKTANAVVKLDEALAALKALPAKFQEMKPEQAKALMDALATLKQKDPAMGAMAATFGANARILKGAHRNLAKEWGNNEDCTHCEKTAAKVLPVRTESLALLQKMSATYRVLAKMSGATCEKMSDQACEKMTDQVCKKDSQEKSECSKCPLTEAKGARAAGDKAFEMWANLPEARKKLSDEDIQTVRASITTLKSGCPGFKAMMASFSALKQGYARLKALNPIGMLKDAKAPTAVAAKGCLVDAKMNHLAMMDALGGGKSCGTSSGDCGGASDCDAAKKDGDCEKACDSKKAAKPEPVSGT